MKPLKLIPELIPEPLWGVSANKLMRPISWKRISDREKSAAGFRCAICRAGGIVAPPETYRDKRLYCHEVWQYDEGKAIATVIELRVLCAGCNAVTHLGRTRLAGEQYFLQALEHLVRVNGITLTELKITVERAFTDWKRRSAIIWREIAVSPPLLKKYPELERLTIWGPHRQTRNP